MDISVNHPSNLESCLNEIRLIFDVEKQTYGEKIGKLEEERRECAEKLKRLEEENAVSRKDNLCLTEEKAMLTKDNLSLVEELSSLRCTVERTDAKLSEVQLKYKTLRRNVEKKQAEWNVFLEKFQKYCKCSFKKKVEKMRGKDHSFGTPTLKGKNVSKVFFMSPVKKKEKFNDTPLAPMTEQFDTTNSPKASTPLVVAETEKFPFGKDKSANAGNESESVIADNGSDSWLNSPPLISEKRLQEKSLKPVTVTEVSSGDDDIQLDDGDTVETSAELFSETVFSNRSERVETNVQQPLGEIELSGKPFEIGGKLFEIGQIDDPKDKPTCKDKLHVTKGSLLSFCEDNTPINTISRIGHAVLQNNKSDSNTEKNKTQTGNQPSSKGKYKYDVVVRKKREREKLSGHLCDECKRYYKSDNLTDEQMEAILKECSRHKHVCTPPPSTPDEFWKIGFPTTQECIAKGYMLDENETLPDHAKPKWRRMKKKRAVRYQ